MITGVFTNIAVLEAQEAESSQGFLIFPTGFAVSDDPGALDPARTSTNPTWYTGSISSRIMVDNNTIKFICTVPPGVGAVSRTIREIYMFGLDTNNVPFLMAIGQPSDPIDYSPAGSTTLQLLLSLANADLSGSFVFTDTVATELTEHVTDPNAHPEYIQAMNKAGVYFNLGGGPKPFAFAGQAFDEKAEWNGAFATTTHSGVTWTADHTGPDGNSIHLVFDGVLTDDQVRLIWNNANPYNTVSHTGSGTHVSAAGSITLGSGSLSVSHGDAVYFDGTFYSKAISDGTLHSKVVGFADLTTTDIKRVVRASGFVTHDTTGFSDGDPVYLSDSVAGGITSTNTGVRIGMVVKTGLILVGTQGGGGGGSAAEFDAVVTTEVGPNFYPSTANAIAAVGSGANILINILEQVKATINPSSKSLSFVFNGPATGWQKFPGTSERFLISFSAVPDAGTWRIEWNSQTSADLLFNDNASTVQSAFNSFSGLSGVVVTGNYTSGFDVTLPVGVNPLPTFLDAGQDNIQRITASATPANGTVKLSWNGNQTAFIAYDATPTEIQTAIQAISSHPTVTVTGSWVTTGYAQIEFTGSFGLQAQSNFVIVSHNFVDGSSNPIVLNQSTIQPGRYPADNLSASAVHVNISVTEEQVGEAVGPNTCFNNTANHTRIIGQGKIEDFTTGIVLNGHTDVDIAVEFVSTTTPIDNTGASTPVSQYKTSGSFGVTQKQIWVVGLDAPDLDTAVTNANAGDVIQVFADQTINSAKTWSKAVTIEFYNEARVIVGTHFTGTVLTLGNRIRTVHMHLYMAVSGAYDTAVKFQGTEGHHIDMRLELNNGGITLTAGFLFDSGSKSVYLDAAYAATAGSCTTLVVNSSGNNSHSLQMRGSTSAFKQNVSTNTTAAWPIRHYNCDPTGGVFSMTLPLAANNDGAEFTFKNTSLGGGNNVNVARSGSDSLEGDTSAVVAPGDYQTWVADGPNNAYYLRT